MKGEAHPMVKLTEAQIAEIRERYLKGDRENGQHALAREFGVRQSNIWFIVNNKTWSHV
jgi:hypothetical protein